MITRVGGFRHHQHHAFRLHCPVPVVAGILPRVAKEYDTPTISIPFDGTASPTTQLQLEAFMEQAHRRLHR